MHDNEAEDVIPLARATLRARVGGKAAGLGAIAAAGGPVAAGFVICSDVLEKALALTGQTNEVLAALGEGEEGLARAHDVVLHLTLPTTLQAQVLAACGALGGSAGPFAVRSSAVAEDSAGASFAGLFHTELGVCGEQELWAAVSKCLASAFAPRVVSYANRAPTTTSITLPRVAVVVQRLVTADAAGVLFSVDPISGDDDVTVIEAVLGLGEPLVSGRAPADRVRVQTSSAAIVERHTANKKSALEVQQGRAVERVVDEVEGQRPVLSDAEARELCELGQLLQEHLGYPVDIEWARTEGRFVLLQARPITAIRFADDVGEWTTADFRDGGVSADVCTPFLWSLYERAFDISMLSSSVRLGLRDPDDKTKWSRMFFGRPFWNLGEVKRTLKKVPGYVERNLDIDMGITPSYEGPGDTTALTLTTALRAVPTLFRMLKDFGDRLRLCREFRASFDRRRQALEKDPATLQALSDNDLAQLFDDVVALQQETETKYFETIYALSNANLDFKPSFASAKILCQGELEYISLVGGLTDLSHMRPVIDLFELAGRIKARGTGPSDDEVHDYAHRWRHHSRRELDIAAPRWDEDLPFIRELIEDAVTHWEAHKDPRLLQQRRHDEALAHKNRALAAIGWRVLLRGGFLWRLERVRSFAWWREEMRDCSTWMYALCRRVTLEVGRRLCAAGTLATAPDVFCLRAEDVSATLRASLPPSEAVRRARQGARVMKGFRAFPCPHEVGGRHALTARKDKGPAPAGALKGTPCSSGRAQSKVRVATTIEEARALEGGEILVAVFTDPGWTLFFPRLAGVVTETGGLLSHAAVIAREYGIPAVLAVPDATTILHTGEVVVVDGSAGLVSRVGD